MMAQIRAIAGYLRQEETRVFRMPESATTWQDNWQTLTLCRLEPTSCVCFRQLYMTKWRHLANIEGYFDEIVCIFVSISLIALHCDMHYVSKEFSPLLFAL